MTSTTSVASIGEGHLRLRIEAVPACLPACLGRCAMWKRKADGDDVGYRILTVGLYLEDHSADTDDRALTVAPYSQHNACYRRPYANYTTARAHPRKGDAVVFDTRISHRGQAKAYANFERNVAQPHRTLLTLNYGLHGEFSDGYDRGFAMRNLVLNNVSACGGKLDVRCRRSSWPRTSA